MEKRNGKEKEKFKRIVARLETAKLRELLRAAKEELERKEKARGT